MQIYNNEHGYGIADNTYQAAGGLVGITRLVNAFYGYMDALEEAEELRSMHADDLSESIKKLTYFLSGWMGGPRLYDEHFGPINIPLAHRFLKAEPRHAKAWLLCMQKALDDQAYPVPLKQYLYEQLSFPANRIVQVAKSDS